MDIVAYRIARGGCPNTSSKAYDGSLADLATTNKVCVDVR